MDCLKIGFKVLGFIIVMAVNRTMMAGEVTVSAAEVSKMFDTHISFQGGKIKNFVAVTVDIKDGLGINSGLLPDGHMRLFAPLDMNILHPDNINLDIAQGQHVFYNSRREVIKVDGGEVVTVAYKKERLGDKEYYVEVILTWRKTDGEMSMFRQSYVLDYQMGRGSAAPVAKRLIITHSRGGKTVYANTEYACPATGKVEKCLLLESGDRKFYAFNIEDRPFLNLYYYEQNGRSLSFNKLKRYKLIGSEYKMVEFRDYKAITKYEYFDNSVVDGKYFGKIKKIVYPNSSSKEYEYFSDGCIKNVKTL